MYTNMPTGEGGLCVPVLSCIESGDKADPNTCHLLGLCPITLLYPEPYLVKTSGYLKGSVSLHLTVCRVFQEGLREDLEWPGGFGSKTVVGQMHVYRQEGKEVCSSLGPHPISSSYVVCAHSHPSPIPSMLYLLGISQAFLKSFLGFISL